MPFETRFTGALPTNLNSPHTVQAVPPDGPLPTRELTFQVMPVYGSSAA